MRLIADVGGTNSRLALSDAGQVISSTKRSYSNDDWDSFYAIVTDYLSPADTPALTEVVVAVAGRVQSDLAHLTNRNWVVETRRLQAICGDVSVHLLNDLTALGYGVPNLRPEQLQTVSEGETNLALISQSLVVGIGTGFNVSLVLESEGQVVCPSFEAGHISMSYDISKLLQEFGFEQEQFQTIESLFSGGGFEFFCGFLARQPTLEGPSAIAAYGQKDMSELTAAVDHYSGLLGHLLRDLTFAYMPSAGIYMAGSVARSILATSPQPFLANFHVPSKLESYSLHPPISIIQDDAAALSGCARINHHR